MRSPGLVIEHIRETRKMANMYTSAQGREIKHLSYSSAETYRSCRRKFKLQKIDGWKERGEKASLEFGKCVENAVQFFYDNGCKPDDAVDTFKGQWAKWQDHPLNFTEQETDWATLYRMGSEMMRLFEVISPNLPIRNAKWQLEFRKQLWPGTEYSDLEFLAYIDVLSILEDGTKLIIDIKTAKSPVDLTPNMLSMDGQLRRYAWVAGVRDVGFLNFVKAKPGMKKGDTVSLLVPSGKWTAGSTAIVFKYDKDADAVYLTDTANLAALEEELDAISGKGSSEAKAGVVGRYIAEEKIVVVSAENLTKTRIQFIRAKIDQEELDTIGQSIGHQMLEIKRSAETNFFPKDGGVKFPNQTCLWCSLRGICLGDNNLRDQMLVQITPAAKPEPDWLDDLEAE